MKGSARVPHNPACRNDCSFTSIPSVIILTALFISLWGGSIRFNSASLFALSFLPMFGIGGLTGLPLVIHSREAEDDTILILREEMAMGTFTPLLHCFTSHRRLADALGGLVLGAAAAALGLSLREAAWAFLGVVLLIFGYYVLWTLAAQLARYDVSPLLAYLPDLFYGALAGALAWRLR